MRFKGAINVALVGLCLFPVACAKERQEAPSTVNAAERERVLAFWRLFRTATDRRIARDCGAAVPLYRQALSLETRHEDTLYYLGQCQRELRQPVEARRTLERLVEAAPASARGHLALGALLASPDPAEPFDLPEAERRLRRAHEINGEETGPMVRLAEVLIVLGRDREARQWLEAATRTNPKSVEAGFLGSYLAWRAGDRQGARVLAERAVQAGRPVEPPKGVLGEGDRRVAGQQAQHAPRAAPPLENPLGRLLFGEAVGVLRRGSGDGRCGLWCESAWQAAREARQSFIQRARR